MQLKICLMILALLCPDFLCYMIGAESYASLNRAEIHNILSKTYNSGDIVRLKQVARTILLENKAAWKRSKYPSVFEYLGVAYYQLGDLEKATETFAKAVRVDDDDVVCWVLLGNAYMYRLMLSEAAVALEVAVLKKGSEKDIHRLFKARMWVANWKDRDEMLPKIEQLIQNEIIENNPTSINAMDFAELPPPKIKALSQLSLAAREEKKSLCCSKKEDFYLRSSKLRLGFISSDFGVHPVAQLVRGLLSFINKDQFTVYCFSLTSASSWWKRNITRSVDYMVSLHGKNAAAAAKIVKSHDIHILLDLNGHTLHSGLGIMGFRPAPVQMSFLGYPMTTGAPFIDYFLSDPITTTPFEANEAFTEKQLYLSTHYIVNDYAQMLGHTVSGDRPALSTIEGGAERPFVFATFSNWQKMDPTTFEAWMQILQRVPNSVFWFLRYAGFRDAEVNLRAEAQARGIQGDTRFIFTDLEPWINHTHMKRSADLVLDTSLKNGHTTMIDALWAGVPIVTLEGSRMNNRAGTSALKSLALQEITVNSIKDYVEVAVNLAMNDNLLATVRGKLETNRLTQPLFDTRTYTNQFESLMRSSWELSKTLFSQPPVGHKNMHIFLPQRQQKIGANKIQISSAAGDPHVEDEYESQVRNAISNNNTILLHIGGWASKENWWIVNIVQKEHTDFVMDMQNLYSFPDNSVTAIYASHVLEHCHFGVGGEVAKTLNEWNRVLKRGGILYVAVPDLYILSSLFVDDSLTEQERFHVMWMMYGGQMDVYDVHKVGFSESSLTAFLSNAGFCNIKRVDDFGLFRDSSVLEFKGRKISLNLMATACK